MYHTLRSLVLLGLLAAPGLSFALTSLCVSNSQQLVSALQSVNSGADNLILIKLRRGTYAPPVSGFSVDMNASGRIVEISGGWTGAGSSCTDKNLGARGTLILGDAGGSALAFNLAAGSNTSLSISDLTFSSLGGSDGACLYGAVNTATTATVDRVRLDRCISNSHSGGFKLFNSGGQAIVRNVVVRGGIGTRSGGIQVESTAGVTWLNHLSITANIARTGANAGGIHITSNSPAAVYLTNSVIWGNTASSLSSDIINNGGGGLAISHIRYGTRNGAGGANASSTGDPGFVATGNPGPRSDSPLINAGLANVIGPGSFDVDGLSRVQDGAADIGAHEGVYAGDEIFRDILP